MLDYSERTLTEIELGKRPCPAHVAKALDELYARWWDTCAQQRALESQLRHMMEDGSCVDLRPDVRGRAIGARAARRKRPKDAC
jgi:hypothetical protein